MGEAPRCDTVFSDRRLKSLFAESLLPATFAQVRNYLATHASVDFNTVARYAQAIGKPHGPRGVLVINPGTVVR